MEELIKNIKQWSIDCNLHKADSRKQLMILLEEFGKLNASILRDDADGVKDAIGDMMAILIILCQQKKEPYFPYVFIESSNEINIYKNIVGISGEISKLTESTYVPVTVITEYLNYIATAYHTTAKECLQSAYDEIKDRRGKMVNGVFVKESDLNG